MKHTTKITIILLSMFLITQLIGLFIINFYLQDGNTLPYGFDQQNIDIQNSFSLLTSMLFSFIIAIFLVLILTKIKSIIFMRAWFFIVVCLALGLTLNVLIFNLKIPHSAIIAIGIGAILAYFKVFKRNIILHNITELLIYPGIAAVFASILNIFTLIVLLAIIAIYDVWAVWHSGIMQKMAKYQIENVKVFGGFFIPYASKKIKNKINFLRQKYKNKNIPGAIIKKNKIKVNLAILGGGDIVFPIISAGVILKAWGLIPALIVILFSFLALLYLFVFAKKKKFYPAMLYLSTGILLGILMGWLTRIFTGG
jgi:presenilin-like A22 family membrane protease